MLDHLYGRGGRKPRLFLLIFSLILSVVFASSKFDSSFETAWSFDASINEPIEAIEPVTLAPIVASYAASRPITIQKANNVSVSNSNALNILGRVVPFVNYNSTNSTPNTGAARLVNSSFNGKFFFAHNSNSGFGGLGNLKAGSTFTITIDGIVHRYNVRVVEDVEKSYIENNHLMNNIARAKWNGQNYSVSLMTCSGVSLGGGDATRRIVLFANEY